MRKLDAVTLIVPENDLESQTIIEVAIKLGFSGDRLIIPKGLKWGARLENVSANDLDRINTKDVWIVELPGPEKEAELQLSGLELTIIDHHYYQDVGNRYNSNSSLEQFSDLCNYDLNQEEKWIAINDRGYLWELADSKTPFEEIQRIRRMDYHAQGWTEDDFFVNLAEYKLIQDKIDNHEKSKNKLFVHQTQLQKTGYLTDLFHMPDIASYDMYREFGLHGYYRRENLLLIIEAAPSRLFFSGTTLQRNKALWCCYWPGMKFWQGGNGRHGYFGIEIPQKERLYKIKDLVQENINSKWR